MILKLAVFMTT